MPRSTGARPSIPIADLPVAALSRPPEALREARAALRVDLSPNDRSLALQAVGIALREMGDMRGALQNLRLALATARAVGRARTADVSSSLGLTLAFAGRIEDGLQHLDEACKMANGAPGARIRVRRGFALQIAGRPDEAADDLRLAARTLRRAHDPVWEARARINLGQALIDGGKGREADAELRKAEKLLLAAEQPYESAIVRHDRGFVAMLLGRIPEALAHFDEAETLYQRAGARPAELSEARCAAFLAAGLPLDALKAGQEALETLRREAGSPAFRANALVIVSDAALASGAPVLARRYATQAQRLYSQQGRVRGRTLARLRAVRARYAAGEVSPRLVREAIDVAREAGRHRLVDAVEAHLIAGELALENGRIDAATHHLGRARRARSHESDLDKALGWQADALLARSSGRSNQLLRACDEGLQVLSTHQLKLGAIETRAAATAHGKPLAAMALTEAVRSGDADLMLRWAERWRATTLELPPLRLADDGELATQLTKLRLTMHRRDEAIRDERPVLGLERDISQLENSVRSLTLRTAAEHGSAVKHTDTADVLAELGDTHLIEIFEVQDLLHVLVVSRDGVRHRLAGSYKRARRTNEYARFALRRITHRAARERAWATLPTLSAALEEDLLGSAVADIGDGPVVIVPPAALSSVPWGVLPSLRGRATSIAASAASWLSARRFDARASTAISVVAGPGLRHSRSEVEKTAQLYPDAKVLGTGSQPATVARVLSVLDGALLAHVAAHGTFRDDNPMFSSLILDDGPLTVFDLQRLGRAPYRLVLSCCDTGAVSAAGADEMLGLLTALTPLGTAGMLAAVAPVSDSAAVEFAAVIHDRLRAGDTTAEALCAARIAAGDDPAAFAIAHAFVSFGAV